MTVTDPFNFDDLPPAQTVDGFDTVGIAVDDGKAACPHCSKVVTVTKTGALRSHKCVNEVTAASRARGKNVKAPESVNTLVTAFAASGVEWSAAIMLARAIPTEYGRARAVTDLTKAQADELIKPIVNAIWPNLPDGARKALINLADHSDLIACAFAWADYFATLRAFAATERARLEQTEGVQNDGLAGQAFPVGGFEPFRPADDA